MEKNMGGWDRKLRLVLGILGVGLVGLGVVAGPLGTVLFILAAIFIITSIIGFCPLYALFSFSTLNKGPKATPPNPK
jgi:uncharacterized membrane protein YuzA (DUF378 family)